MWNKDEVKGRAERVKGQVKESAGKVTNDERLRNEGVADQAEGRVQEGFGRGRRKIGKAISDVADKIGR
jgi:uncharacterized protein YjbJ (UPF0337 family)